MSATSFDRREVHFLVVPLIRLIIKEASTGNNLLNVVINALWLHHISFEKKKSAFIYLSHWTLYFFYFMLLIYLAYLLWCAFIQVLKYSKECVPALHRIYVIKVVVKPVLVDSDKNVQCSLCQTIWFSCSKQSVHVERSACDISTVYCTPTL